MENREREREITSEMERKNEHLTRYVACFYHQLFSAGAADMFDNKPTKLEYNH